MGSGANRMFQLTKGDHRTATCLNVHFNIR